MFDKIKGIFRRKTEIIDTVKSLVSVSPGNSWHSVVLSSTGRVSNTLAMSMYDENSAVATCVDMISGAVESMELVIYNRDTDEIVNNKLSKNILNFLEQPNGFETKIDIIGKLTRHFLLTGNAYTLIIGMDTPRQLYAINPSIISATAGLDGYPEQYIISAYVGSGTTFKRDITDPSFYRFKSADGLKEFYHIMGYTNQAINIVGSSVLDAVAEDIRQQIAGRMHNKKLLENGATPSLAIVFQDEVPPTDAIIKQRQETIDKTMKGYNNAGKIMQFSSKDMKVEKLMQANNKDMDYVNLDEISSKAIYRRYGIPLPLVDTSGATFSNVDASIPYFYHQTVLPVADKILSNLSKVLCPRFGLDPKIYQITYDINNINSLSNYQLSQLQKRSEIGIETINEMRTSLTNRDPLKDGDVLPVKTQKGGKDDQTINGSTSKNT